jgi:hypothetical protein
MATRMQQRRGTATQWTTANPILAAGEIGFESGTNKFKIGDGVNTWSALTYYASAAEIAALVDGAPDLLNTLNELAAAIGDDANFGTAIEASINTSVDEANTFTTTAVSTHRQLTQAVHGIADTSLLATTANVATAKTEAIAAAASAAQVISTADTTAAQAAAVVLAAAETDTKIGTHNTDTTNVHGIPDTSVLATATTVATAKSEAITAAATDATNRVATGKSEAIAAAATASESYSDASITTHNNDTTNVHGIVDTAALALSATVATDIATAVTTHNDDTTNVHGIANTALLETSTAAQAKADAAQSAATAAAATAAGSALSTHNTATTNIHGIANTALLATTADVAAVTKTSLGLGNVDNTADTAKPVSTAQSSAIATAKAEAIADATSQVNALLTGAPAALNTLDELAAALGDDANFAASVTTSLGLKVDSLTPISQKTASYTLSSLTERDDLIEMGSASALTLTIPTDATLDFPIGTSIDILQTGAGQVTIAPVSGTVTVNATPGLKLRTTWSSATLMKRAANTWVVFGDLTA